MALTIIRITRCFALNLFSTEIIAMGIMGGITELGNDISACLHV